jgi:SRSO17 transposase
VNGLNYPGVAVLARVDDIEASRLASGLDDAFALAAGWFFRREVRARARACVAGMLSGLERKTGWSLAEHAGEAVRDGMQRLFTTARWDEDAVRDDLRGYVAATLGDPGGVLIGDDTGVREERRLLSRGCSGSTRARPGRSPTASSASSWLTPGRRAAH